MYNGNTTCVEANQTQHSPVEILGLDKMADSETNLLFFPPEVGQALILAFHASPGKR